MVLVRFANATEIADVWSVSECHLRSLQGNCMSFGEARWEQWNIWVGGTHQNVQYLPHTHKYVS